MPASVVNNVVQGLEDVGGIFSMEDISLFIYIHTYSYIQSNYHINKSNLSQEFETMVSEIRRLDGFERFLLGPSVDELIRLSSWGPIIIFNVSDIRSDVFLVATTGVHFSRFHC